MLCVLQARQQEVQLHQKQLSECTREPLDTLAAETAVLEPGCDELQLQREQVEHYRGLRMEGNKKNAELQLQLQVWVGG